MINKIKHSGAGADHRRDGLPYWRRKRLDQMTEAEWEGLCDRCGRCCLMKLEDEDTGHIYATDVGCRLLNDQSCQCQDYESRHEIVTDCVQMSAAIVADLSWLPMTCAYRLVDEGRDLYWWHHLVSGDYDTVHVAGISVKGRIFEEDTILPADLENHIVDWPFKDLPGPEKTTRPGHVKKSPDTQKTG